MTPQEVIKAFMQKLSSHGLSKPTGEQMLDAAVKATSKFVGIQAAIDQFLADREAAELAAIKEVYGEDTSYKKLSDVPSSDSNRVKIAIANKFLNDYCGIVLNQNYSSFDVDYNYGDKANPKIGDLAYNAAQNDNTDTGAITGSDANITLTADENGSFSALGGGSGYSFSQDSLDKLITEGIAHRDGDSYIIGSGSLKNKDTVVPEFGNLYTAGTTNAGQIINTGSNDWLVKATDLDDVITSGGIDSINAGAGNDVINVNANDATITSGDGFDVINVASNVNRVTLTDLKNGDKLNIGGAFKIQSAIKSGSTLIITDTSGERVINISNPDAAKVILVNGSTLSDWLSQAGFDIDDLVDVSKQAALDNAELGIRNAELEFDLDNAELSQGRAAFDGDYLPPSSSKVKLKAARPRKALAYQGTQKVFVDLDNAITGEQATGFFLSDGTFVNTATDAQTTVGSVSYDFPDLLDFSSHGLNMHYKGYTNSTAPNNASYVSYDKLGTKKNVVAGLYQWWIKEPLNLTTLMLTSPVLMVLAQALAI